MRAMAARGMALVVLDLPKGVDPAYEHRLVLVRPDQHVGWRGDDVPADPVALAGCGEGRKEAVLF